MKLKLFTLALGLALVYSPVEARESKECSKRSSAGLFAQTTPAQKSVKKERKGPKGQKVRTSNAKSTR